MSWGFGDEAVGAERGWQTAGWDGGVAQAKSRAGGEKTWLEASAGGSEIPGRSLGFPQHGAQVSNDFILNEGHSEPGGHGDLGVLALYSFSVASQRGKGIPCWMGVGWWDGKTQAWS